jgi:hypothetical protein
MRTVTFSDEKVIAALSKDFACAWENRAPGFHDCRSKPIDGCGFFPAPDIPDKHALPIGILATFLMTADLQVVHYLSGYWAPPLFVDQLEVGKEARTALAQPEPLESFKAVHGARRAHCADQRRSMSSTGEEGAWAKDLLLDYLIRVHESFERGTSMETDGHSLWWDEVGSVRARKDQAGPTGCILASALETETVAGVPALSSMRHRYLALDRESLEALGVDCGSPEPQPRKSCGCKPGGG